MTIKAAPGDIQTQSSAGMEPWVLKTRHTPAQVDGPEYWQNLHAFLDWGAQVRVLCREPDGSCHQAEFFVKNSEPGCVIVERVAEWRYFGLDLSDNVEAVNEREAGNQIVVDVKDRLTGRTIKRGVTRDVADALIFQYTAKTATRRRKAEEAA